MMLLVVCAQHIESVPHCLQNTMNTACLIRYACVDQIEWRPLGLVTLTVVNLCVEAMVVCVYLSVNGVQRLFFPTHPNDALDRVNILVFCRWRAFWARSFIHTRCTTSPTSIRLCIRL